MGSITWGRELAEIYDSTYAAEFEPPLLDPIVDTLADLAQGGGSPKSGNSINSPARSKSLDRVTQLLNR